MIDPADGGAPDARTYVLHRDGYRDQRAVVHLASPHDVRVSLARAAGRSRPPRSKRHHAAPHRPAKPAHHATAAAVPTPTPPAPPPPAKPKPKPAHHGKAGVDPTATLDPFAQ